MRWVLDTNTALSGLIWGGNAGHLIDAAEQQRIELASSTALLAELLDVLSRPKFAKQFAQRGLNARDLFDGYAALIVSVTPLFTPRVIPNDPDDDHVIACAIAAQADAIVSGDHHILDLQPAYQGIDILTPAQAVERIV